MFIILGKFKDNVEFKQEPYFYNVKERETLQTCSLIEGTQYIFIIIITWLNEILGW